MGQFFLCVFRYLYHPLIPNSVRSGRSIILLMGVFFYVQWSHLHTKLKTNYNDLHCLTLDISARAHACLPKQEGKVM